MGTVVKKRHDPHDLNVHKLVIRPEGIQETLQRYRIAVAPCGKMSVASASFNRADRTPAESAGGRLQRSASP